MKIGVFGGSFDPVHLGHLRVAETCRQAVPLDLVLFVPAAAQPLKPQGPIASPEDRVAGAGAAMRKCSTLEIERGGISYTVDTLRELQSRCEEDELVLILGRDAVQDLPSWREPEAITRLATLVVVNRPGAALVPESPGWMGEAGLSQPPRLIQVAMEPIDISSSEIRDRIARGESIDEFVPPAVAAYMETKGLYGPAFAVQVDAAYAAGRSEDAGPNSGVSSASACRE